MDRLLTNDDNPLYRHIKLANFIQNDKVLNGTFRPRGVDEGCLSVYDGWKMTAEESFRHQEIDCHSTSLAAAKLVVGDCRGIGIDGGLDLDVFESPKNDNPAHAHIDFNKRPSSVSIRRLQIL